MDELRIPKRRVEVELVLAGHGARRVVLFLSDFAVGHDGAERVSDLLNDPPDFLPARDLATDQVLFVQREQVVVARVAREPEPEDAERYTLPTEHEVVLLLADGQRVSGLVTYVLPPDRSRLVDYLNAAPPFVRVHEGEREAYVNRRYVVCVETASR